MSNEEFLQRLNVIRSRMENCYFRVYQPHRTKEVDFDELLYALDKASQCRSFELKQKDLDVPWSSTRPCGILLNASQDFDNEQQLDQHAEILKELGIGWVLISDQEKPFNDQTEQQMKNWIDAWHQRGFAVGLTLNLSSTAPDDPWAQLALQQASFRQYYRMSADQKMISVMSGYDQDQNVQKVEEIGQYVFCTPSQRWLLDYKNPEVLKSMLIRFISYANLGADAILLEDSDRCWHECRQLPLYSQTRDIITLFMLVRDLVCPSVLVMAQGQLPSSLLTHLADGSQSEVSIVDSGSMVNAWNALATRDTCCMKTDMIFHSLENPGMAVRICRREGISWDFNEEAAMSHGWNPEDHRRFLREFTEGKGIGSFCDGKVDHKTGISYGTLASLAGCSRAEANHELYEMEDGIRRVILMLSLALVRTGIPLIQSGDELGWYNDHSYLLDPDKAEDLRWLGRPRFIAEKAERRHQPLTMEYRIFQACRKMIGIRQKHPVISCGQEQVLTDLENGLLGFRKTVPGETLVAVANFTEIPKYCETGKLLKKNETGTDWLSGRKVSHDQSYLCLKPYEFLWIGITEEK